MYLDVALVPGVVVVDAGFIGLVATADATAFLPQTFHSLRAKESHYKKQLQKKSWEMETMRQHMQQVRVMRCNVRCDGVGECSVQVKCEVWRGLVGCGRAYACSYTYMLWTCVFKTSSS